MTERLAQLLHDQADHLDVPPVAADAALTRGRGLRRRRNVAVTGAVVAVLAVIGGVALTATGGDDDRAIDPATPSSAGLAFAIGNNVYVDGGSTRATIDDTSVKSLFYTSAGVLVRQGDNPNSDGGGPQRFSLVTADGTVKPISVVTEETVHSTDPTQPYLAYAETKMDGSTDVVVWNLETDSEEARVPLPGGLTWGGWPAPPVSLDGDDVYVGTDDTARVVNWRTGEVTETDAVPAGYVEVSGGRAAEGDHVVDARTGQTLLRVDGGGDTFLRLSPDGRYAIAQSYDEDRPAVVYDIDAKSHVEVPTAPRGYGWSPDGLLFAVDGHELTTCSPTSGDCRSSGLDLVEEPQDSQGEMTRCDEETGVCTPVGPPPDYSGELRLGGMIYES